MNSTDCTSLPIVFLTWFRHRRTTEIARHLRIPLIELTTSRRGMLRYVELTLRTFSTLSRSHARVVIVQSPSLVLSIVALVLRPLLGYALVVDAHNEAVEPYLNTGRLVRFLTYWVLRNANSVIVTNPPLARKVQAHGGKTAILPDRVPDAPAVARRALSGSFHIVVISTFAGDEPIEIVLEAARRIGPAVSFFITGNAARLPPHLRAGVAGNVTLTGFLDEADYWSLLASCDMVMDLTTMEDCLVCGAYEALAVGTPLILSDNQASTELFHDAALFTQNTASCVVETTQRAIAQHPTLMKQLPLARSRIDSLWNTSAAELVARLRDLCGMARA